MLFVAAKIGKFKFKCRQKTACYAILCSFIPIKLERGYFLPYFAVIINHFKIYLTLRTVC